MIGILFHGPEIFDTGWGQKILELSGECKPECMLGGTMGRTAVIDHALEGAVEVPGLKPSGCLRELAIRCNRIIIASYAKSQNSGHVFAATIMERAGIGGPTIFLECNSMTLAAWNQPDHELLDLFGAEGFRMVEPYKDGGSIWAGGGDVLRRVRAAEPGDFILLNGIIVGEAVSEDVVIVSRNGQIIDIRGANIKQHGVEHLGEVDLRNIKIDSTRSIRGTEYTPRRVDRESGTGVAFINHSAFDIYEAAKGISGAVAVGDDTSAICADILYRFNIPVLGIVDGDRDALLNSNLASKGSVKLVVKSDDEFGSVVQDKIFNGRNRIEMDFNDVVEWVAQLADDEGLLVDRMM